MTASNDSLWQAKVKIQVQIPAEDTSQEHWRQDQETRQV